MMAGEQRTSRYTRRRALSKAGGGVLALTAGGGFLSACGSSSGGKEDSLTAWWWSDAAQMPSWQAAVDKKFKSKKGVGVTVVQQQLQNFVSNFTAAAAAKSGPDVAGQWATQPVLAQAWSGAVTPISDYVPASETAHWSFRQENLYGGKLYAMPLYVIGQPFCLNKKLFAQAGLDPTAPPKTWDQFLAACKTLKAKGITPLAIGNKDTFGGRWAFAFLGMQNLDSPDDLKAPLLGEASFGDPKYSEWMTRWKELIDQKYYNDDAMSLDSNGGGDQFKAGKAAMSWTVENVAISWGEALGYENVAQFQFPKFGNGKLADAYTATQSTSYFITSWAKDPKVAAEYLQFLHEPAQLASLYKVCKFVPADDRFDRSVITNPLRKALADRASTGLQVWLENWIPPSLDDNANGPGGQKLMTGASVKSVAALWDQQAKAWRAQNPAIAKRFRQWQMKPVTV